MMNLVNQLKPLMHQGEKLTAQIIKAREEKAHTARRDTEKKSELQRAQRGRQKIEEEINIYTWQKISQKTN